jgi:AcrR family transcriptional regulator
MTTKDRRVARTKRALERAMVDLILEKGFESTNISEIAERANVGRSTFYTHYADKEDLLQGALEQLKADLQSWSEGARLSEGANVHAALAFCLPMLEHAQENRRLFEAMAGRRSGYLFMELIHEVWADLVRSGWPGADEIAVQAIAGGLGSTLVWWLTKEPELPPAEVDRRFRALIEPALRETTAPPSAEEPSS